MWYLWVSFVSFRLVPNLTKFVLISVDSGTTYRRIVADHRGNLSEISVFNPLAQPWCTETPPAPISRCNVAVPYRSITVPQFIGGARILGVTWGVPQSNIRDPGLARWPVQKREIAGVGQRSAFSLEPTL